MRNYHYDYPNYVVPEDALDSISDVIKEHFSVKKDAAQAPSNITDEANPKDRLGVKKVSISKLPAVAILHGAHAMMDGAKKYGPYNWREKKVRASIYLDAAQRHLALWQEREEVAPDSGVHHLGHAIACLAILLDAQATGNLVDDRPQNGRVSEVLNDLNKKIMQQEKTDE